MAYPTTLDSFTANVDNVDVIYASDVNELQTAITSLEAKVGADSSAVTTSHDYKLGEVTSTDKAVGKTATQTLTNKTLTSPVVNVGSDATGDMYYRNAGALTRIPVGTDNQILKLNGTTPNWETETVTVNASTTVAGIVEEATQSQVDSETGTGETGARLFVNPSTLSTSSIGVNYIAAESITAGDSLASYFYQSDGGVSYDSKTLNNSSVSSAGGTQTFALTVGSNSNRILLVYVSVGAASGTVPTPTVTYNGVSMSSVRTETVASSQKLFSFSLSAPSTGANNVVVTLGASAQTNYVSTAAISYYNVSSIESSTGSTTSTVAYGIPAKGVLLSTGCGHNATTASVNNLNNQQLGTTNTFTCISSADSGISFSSSSVTVTWSGSNPMTVIGLTPVTSLSYGYVVKASASTPVNTCNLNKYTSFIGFARSTVSATQTVKATIDGNVTGLTSLTPLSTYYLADTAGAISVTAGTNSKKVGLAVTTTTLHLKDTI